MDILEAAEAVRRRFSDVPGLFKVPAPGVEMYVLRDFLTDKECSALVALIDEGREPSRLLAHTGDPEFRTSESCNLDPAHPGVRAVERKIAQVIGLDPACGETIQGQRYAVGQQFKPHHDFFHTDQAYWPEMERSGGQRTWTAMVFLNAPEAGGQTAFPDAGIKVAPRPGNLLAWNNLDAKGEPNPYTLHQGCPVMAGAKYVITKWFRERPWSPSDIQTY